MLNDDELLARIKQYSDWAEVAFDTSPTNALRAVVELPMETKAKGMLMTAPANATLPELASLFYEQGYATAMKVVIQAIEKELK